MILSSVLTVGQVTFIFRIVIQILSYGGPVLIGLIFWSSVPLLATVDTHDIANRFAGASTATRSKARWILNHIRRNSADPPPRTKLLYILTLSITYTLFVSLSDIGFLGLSTCSVPGPSFLDFPASIASENAARSFIAEMNMIQPDIQALATVSAWRCDSSSLFPDNPLLFNCTFWDKSTYADPTLFAGINTTDSDILLSRQLGRFISPEPDYDINSFYRGPDTKRLLVPTISGGLAINPHTTGVQIVAGVPQLGPNTEVTIPQTMGIEVEIGCMTIGVTSIQQAGGLMAFDFMVVDDNQWETYVGPDYLHDVLFQSATATRDYLRPFFDETQLSNGRIKSFNRSLTQLTLVAKVTQVFLPSMATGPTSSVIAPTRSLLDNCTATLQDKLGITPTLPQHDIEDVPMCGYFGVAGLQSSQGGSQLAFEQMICASTTQVNMISSSISVSPTNDTKITSLVRLPSDLNYFRADFFENVAGSSLIFSPYERFTLTPSPDGLTSHLVFPEAFPLEPSLPGPGTGGSLISQLNSFLYDNDIVLSMDYSGLAPLTPSFGLVNNFSPDIITEWLGQVMGSIVSASITYNAYAALQVPPLLVTSTGGFPGTCYNPPYAFGVLPLVIAVLIVLIWIIVSLFQRSLSGAKRVKRLYVGLEPFISLKDLAKGTLATWRRQGLRPRLNVLYEEEDPPTNQSSGTVSEFLKARPTA